MCEQASTLEEIRAAKTILSALERLRSKRVSAFRDRGKQAGAAKLEIEQNKQITNPLGESLLVRIGLSSRSERLSKRTPLTAILLVGIGWKTGQHRLPG